MLRTGGVALCHDCQYAIYWQGGLLEYLLKHLFKELSDLGVPVGNAGRIGFTPKNVRKSYARNFDK